MIPPCSFRNKTKHLQAPCAPFSFYEVDGAHPFYGWGAKISFGGSTAGGSASTPHSPATLCVPFGDIPSE